MIESIHNFYSQTGFSFNLNFKIPNNFVYKRFDFLNSNENLSIIIESGKIKDYNNNFICSFNKNGNVNLSGNCSNSNFNLFLENHIIYNNFDNYGACSGVKYSSSEDDLNNTRIKIYGEKPIYHIQNDNLVYSEDVIKLKISGDQNNLDSFKIYQLDIGGTLNSDLGNFSYVPRNFFEISGSTIWESGLNIEPGQVLDFNILQKFVFFTNGTTYIPIYIDTNFGTIYKRLFVEVVSRGTIELINFNFNIIPVVEGDTSTRAPSDFIGTGPDINLDYASSSPNYALYDHAKFIGNISIQSPKQREKEFLVYISGLNGNNHVANNFADTFTGSWTIESPSLIFEPDIFYSGITLIDTTDNLSLSKNKSGIYFDFLKNESDIITGISGIESSQISIDSGYFRGIVFRIPYEYNQRWSITGIDFGLYKTGVFVNNESALLSGGNLNFGLYRVVGNNFTLTDKIKDYNFIVNDLYKTTIDEFNVYSLTGVFDIQPNTKYALVISGYSSGHLSGYKLFLPTGNMDYYSQDIIYETGIYGPINIINTFPPERDEKLPFIKLKGNKESDNNIFKGNANIELPASNSINLNIYKIYNYYNDSRFTGSALLYVSGYSGLEASGILSVYQNEFREINASFSPLSVI